MGRRAAVLGHPIAHSLSPTLHRAAYAALGLNTWRYDVVDLAADQLGAFLESLTGEWAGLSLTMPLKQTVIALLDHIEPLAEVVGAVNTVLVQAGRARPVLTGANTDVYGIVTALGEALGPARVPSVRRTAAVIGGGATAASTLAALAQLGCTTPVVDGRAR
ncbi:MAG: shikimate dehydrogenase, partial [Cellulomonas sp.]|nr:shikimate dehydrogenase [Cellulomonas sp.]